MRNTSDDGDTLVARSILSVRRVDRWTTLGPS